MERKGGIRMGNTCKSMADSCQCMTKPTTIKKIIIKTKQTNKKKVKEESEKVGLKLNIQKTKIMASGPITSWEIDEETMETVTDFIFLAPKALWTVTAAMKLKDTCALEGSYDIPGQHIKKQRYYFSNKGPSSQSYGFSSGHVWI